MGKNMDIYKINNKLICHKKIIFHGGCENCLSQSKYGLERCVGCQYFEGDWSLSDLCIDNDETEEIIELVKIHKQL